MLFTNGRIVWLVNHAKRSTEGREDGRERAQARTTLSALDAFDHLDNGQHKKHMFVHSFLGRQKQQRNGVII